MIDCSKNTITVNGHEVDDRDFVYEYKGTWYPFTPDPELVSRVCNEYRLRGYEYEEIQQLVLAKRRAV